ncbi:MAG: hypothetical protein KQJ78_07000 [Deltaproteobacteria bacterium]|nr:hypothetical protein [Deltaproteobacteria bacterium]
MKAVLLALGRSPLLRRTGERRPDFLMPLMDRPFVLHVLDRLAAQGFREVHLVVDTAVEKAQSCLGDGSRWNLHLHYLTTGNPARPFEALAPLPCPTREPVLLAQANRLPWLNLAACRPPAGRSLLITTGLQREFSGWAWLEHGLFRRLDPSWGEKELLDQLQQSVARVAHTHCQLSCRSHAELFESHRQILAGKAPGLVLGARQVEPGVWLGPEVNLHPTAQVAPPVYLGPGCRLEAESRVGPWAVLGQGAVLERQSRVERSVVLAHSRLTPGVQVQRALVDRALMIRMQPDAPKGVWEGACPEGPDRSRLQWGLRLLVNRGLGVALCVMCLPLTLASLAWHGRPRGGGLRRFEVCRLPLAESEAPATFDLWSLEPGLNHPGACNGRHFFRRFLPGLCAVAKGDLALVGLAAMTSEETAALAPDRKALRRQAPAGLLDAASVLLGPDGDPEEVYSAEACYLVRQGPLGDLRIISLYLAKLLGLSPRGPAGRPREARPLRPAAAPRRWERRTAGK